MSEMLIDITRLLSRFMQGRIPTGVDRVCLAYIRQYGAMARAFIYKTGLGGVLSHSASQKIFKLLLEPGGNFLRFSLPIFASSSLKPFHHVNETNSLLVNIGHSGLEKRGYAAWLTGKKIRSVFMVHDLIPITHPEYCRSGESRRHTIRMRTVLRTAAGIVTNSRETMLALREFAQNSGLEMPPAAVAPLGCGILHLSAKSCPLPMPFFVILGTIEPRKNHWMLLQVWRRLIERHGDDAPRLIVIGQRGWESENVLNLLDRCPVLRGFVIERSDCSDNEVARYLLNARALLFPSFIEGYGLPLLEALSIGLPVIASNLPVFKEIADTVPDYLDPLDGIGWSKRIEDYSMDNSPARMAQLKRMRGLNLPTWHEHFKVMDSLLDQLRN